MEQDWTQFENFSAGEATGEVAGKTVSTPVKKIFDVYSGVDTVFKQTAFETLD